MMNKEVLKGLQKGTCEGHVLIRKLKFNETIFFNPIEKNSIIRN